MKKNFLSWLFISLFVVAGFTACDDDDDNNSTTNVIFPAKVVLNCDANETTEITFDAADNWTLSSSQLWCTFGENQEYSLNGNAGKQTVKLNISDVAQSTDSKSVAQITLNIGSKSAVIADVERNAKGFELKVTDAEGNEVSVIEVGYDEYIEYNFTANFRFAATNRPEWVALDGGSIVGTPNGSVKGGLKFAADGTSEKYSIAEDKGYTISFSDEKGLCTKSIPVIYKGMPADALNYEGPKYYGWVVSMDGKTFTQTTENGLDGSSSNLTFPNFVPFTIKALNDEYVPVVFEVVEQWGMTMIHMNGEEYPIDWIRVEDKGKGSVLVKVDESYEGVERKGIVMMFAKAEYDELTANGGWYGKVIISNPETYNQEIAWEYQQSNLLMQFEQKEIKQGGDEEEVLFKVSYFDSSWMSVEPELTKVTDEYYTSEYGDIPFYSMTYPEGSYFSFLIDPLMEGNYDESWTYFAVMAGKYLTESDNIAFDGMSSLSFWFEEPITQEVVIIIKNKETYKNEKGLIIRPN